MGVVLLTISTTHELLGNLGTTVGLAADRVHEFAMPYGRAYVCFPRTGSRRSTAALLVDVDPVLPSGNASEHLSLDSYVNDRPYASAQMLAMALSVAFQKAMLARSPAGTQPLIVSIPVLRYPQGARTAVTLARALFQPLGWRVAATPIPLIGLVGQPPVEPCLHFKLVLAGRMRLASALQQLCLLLPVLDDLPHTSVDIGLTKALLLASDHWLNDHPSRDTIITCHQTTSTTPSSDTARRLAFTANLSQAQPPDSARNDNGRPDDPNLELVDTAVIAALAASGAVSVVDLRCRDGRLLSKLARDSRFTDIVGVDMSLSWLRRAATRLGTSTADVGDTLPGRGKLRLMQSSLTYMDSRLKGFDAAILLDAAAEADRAAVAGTILGVARPETVIICSPSLGDEPNPSLAGWASHAARLWGYTVSITDIDQTDPVFTIAVLTLERGASPTLPSASGNRIDLAAIMPQPRRQLNTGYGLVPIDAEQAGYALEAISRYAIDPRWLLYLPPTLTPASTSTVEGHLEHPNETFADYRAAGVTELICQEKHMGHRALVLVCDNSATAQRHFGATGQLGVVYTRTGQPFFVDDLLNRAMVDQVRAAVTAADLWTALKTNWLLLDAELLPWSARELPTIRGRYAGITSAAGIALSQALYTLDLSARHGVRTGALRERLTARAANISRFTEAYQRFIRPTSGLAGVTLAPFAILAGNGEHYTRHPVIWHFEHLNRLIGTAPELFTPTRYRLVDLDDPASVADATGWWAELTAGGGEGMVVKPVTGLARELNGQLAFSAIKCRGREYLRMVYGPDYTEPANLDRLRHRRLDRKRRLARDEHALGLAALDRAAAGESPTRIHEMIFALLALESVPVDPRL